MSWGSVGLGALAALVAMPAWREARRRPMDEAAREHAPGRFAALPQGLTHYDWIGPEGAPVAVCVHGLTTPSFVWLGLAPHLNAMGYRMLVYDLYGRGFSASPRGPQTTAFFTRQLRDLLAHEGVADDVALIGYSMGGAIATAFAAAEPERLSRLCLIAPVGMGHELGPFARRAADWHGLGDWAFFMTWPSSARHSIEEDRDLPSTVPGIADRQLAELDRRGYVRSVLASLRGILREDMEPAHRTIASAGLPVTAVWGREDTTIPLRAMGRLTQWNRNAFQVVVEDADHGIPHTHAQKVAEAIRDGAP